MSHEASDDSREADSLEEHTPWNHQDGSPPRDSRDGAPRGPPPPVPVRGPAPSTVPTAADTPPCASANATANSRDGGESHWEQDHRDGPQPVVILDANGERRIARVAGPLLPSGRFADHSSSSSSDSMDGDDTGDEDEVRSPDRGPDGHPADEAETSLALSQAKDYLCSLYRRELQDRAADEGQAWTTRSLSAQVGALRRRAAPADWSTVQQLASLRLTAARAREWSVFEQRAMHEQRPRRRSSRSRS